MDDLTIVRRRKGTIGQWMSYSKPILKLEDVKKGRFVLYNKTSELLGVGNNEAVMFAFSKSAKKGFIFPEEVLPDSYILKKNTRDYYRFTNKDLGKWFQDVFDLKSNSVYFKVNNTANGKGYFELILINNTEEL